jgi:hypothetical protein
MEQRRHRLEDLFNDRSNGQTDAGAAGARAADTADRERRETTRGAA